MPIERARAIARALDAELVLVLRWRGGDVDRLVDEAHALLIGLVVDLLEHAGWVVRIEVSYSVYGERGSIDVLAWHAATRTLLVIEVKSRLMSVEETLRKHGEKVRLAARVAAEQFGWHAAAVGRLLVLPDDSTSRRRAERHRHVLDRAYPMRGSVLRRWLGAPVRLEVEPAGLLFLSFPHGMRGRCGSVTRTRIRGRRVAEPRA